MIKQIKNLKTPKTKYSFLSFVDDYVMHSPCLGQSDNQAFSRMCLEVQDGVLTHQNWCQ